MRKILYYIAHLTGWCVGWLWHIDNGGRIITKTDKDGHIHVIFKCVICGKEKQT
jgi:hypothetical protein